MPIFAITRGWGVTPDEVQAVAIVKLTALAHFHAYFQRT